MNNLKAAVACPLIASALLSCSASVLLAAKCADAPVTAKGEESSYAWLAKTKARANWRRKVRSLSNLGAAYADWGKASDTEEKCLSGGAGVVCTFTGTPCVP